jgi:hypothetical protein
MKLLRTLQERFLIVRRTKDIKELQKEVMDSRMRLTGSSTPIPRIWLFPFHLETEVEHFSAHV